MLKLTVIGNLTKDPQRKTLASGTEVTDMRVAAHYKKRGEDKTTYVNASAYGKVGEVAARYLSKGKQVYLELRDVEFTAGESQVFINGVVDTMEMLSTRGGDAAEEEVEHMKQMFAQAPKSPQPEPKGTVVETPPDLPWDANGSSQESELPF